MRPHPLLALFTATTAAAIATTGALNESAYAAQTAHQPHKTAHQPHKKQHSSIHLDLKELAVGGTPSSRSKAPQTRLSGALPLTFAVTGGPVLGSYLPPALRRKELAAHRHKLAEQRARARRHHAHLVALRRRAKASARHHVYSPAGGVWAELRSCESGGNYAEDSGNGFYGAYQFLPSTWWSLGFSGMPNQAPPAVQDRAARLLLQRQGWGAWPACSQMLGL